jgi:hypothetical protein
MRSATERQIGQARRGTDTRRMRRSGVRGVTICCTTCLHLANLIPDDWPDEAQLADLQQRFVCQECGHKGADIEPDFDWNKHPPA